MQSVINETRGYRRAIKDITADLELMFAHNDPEEYAQVIQVILFNLNEESREELKKEVLK